MSSVANQKATNSGIIIIGGKNAALNNNFKPGDAVSLNPQPLPPKVAFADKFSNSSAALLQSTRSGFSGGDSASTFRSIHRLTVGRLIYQRQARCRGTSLIPTTTPN